MGDPYYYRKRSSPVSALRGTQCSKYGSGPLGWPPSVRYDDRFPHLKSRRYDLYQRATSALAELDKLRHIKPLYHFMKQVVSQSFLDFGEEDEVVVLLKYTFDFNQAVKGNFYLNALVNKSIDDIHRQVEEYLTREITTEIKTSYGKRRRKHLTNTGKMVSKLAQVSSLLGHLDTLWGIYKAGDNKRLINQQRTSRQEEALERKVWFAAKFYVTARYGVRSGVNFQKQALKARESWFKYDKQFMKVKSYEAKEYKLAHPNRHYHKRHQLHDR